MNHNQGTPILLAKDLVLLQTLADFRLATVPLLAARLGISEQMIRRRCRRMSRCGFLTTCPRNSGYGRGRPEWVYSVTPAAVQQLTAAKLLPPDVPADQVTGESLLRTAEHQILLNWLAVHSKAIEKQGNEFEVKFISSTSPLHSSGVRGAIVCDRVELPDGSSISFTPDAALCITHKGLKKSLLFFLEVDRGTETVADPKRASDADVRRKIIIYRTYLGRRGYKRYENENLFNAKFHGFRLLVVVSSESRCRSLCRLVRDMTPSDFVWVSDLSIIRRYGIGGPIWRRGGNDLHECSSILPAFSLSGGIQNSNESQTHSHVERNKPFMTSTARLR
jgi:DNA-binding MarR family transcriptional regulator